MDHVFWIDSLYVFYRHYEASKLCESLLSQAITEFKFLHYSYNVKNLFVSSVFTIQVYISMISCTMQHLTNRQWGYTCDWYDEDCKSEPLIRRYVHNCQLTDPATETDDHVSYWLHNYSVKVYVKQVCRIADLFDAIEWNIFHYFYRRVLSFIWDHAHNSVKGHILPCIIHAIDVMPDWYLLLHHKKKSCVNSSDPIGLIYWSWVLWAIASEYSLCYTIQKDKLLTFQYTSLCNIKVTCTKLQPSTYHCLFFVYELSVNVN